MNVKGDVWGDITFFFYSYTHISLQDFLHRLYLHYSHVDELYPELNFADQTHFIKEVKKFSGLVDAAYLMPPYAGEGFNMAMLDA